MSAERLPEYGRCLECDEVVELELRRDFENHAEWRLGGHWGNSGFGCPYTGSTRFDSWPDVVSVHYTDAFAIVVTT